MKIRNVLVIGGILWLLGCVFIIATEENKRVTTAIGAALDAAHDH